ncbi:MAG: Fur family transcriptional regulator [Caldicoprobacterales bacterium]|jgi:Fur family peroxide stress response transcriptional regulator|nr:Fur family transcriptional regulator [Bacillota bacterium]NLH58932.1 transcriptional repressor [Clostridiales bacterium]
MLLTYDQILEQLKEKGINLSYQRLKVLDFLYKNQIHPTVEQIYLGLVKQIPTLSKTTIYNTLKILINAGLVREIPFKGRESCYDINLDPHGHFCCDSCNQIYDFQIDVNLIKSKDLEDFKIRDRDVYFKGVCSRCLSKI